MELIVCAGRDRTLKQMDLCTVRCQRGISQQPRSALPQLSLSKSLMLYMLGQMEMA